MSGSQVFALERFYYGHLIVEGRPASAAPGVIARTPNIVPEEVAECLHVASLAPPRGDEISAEMPGSLGLFQGETIDFILAKAQYNEAGVAQILYILVPGALIRQLGGNILAFRSLATISMPVFSAMRPNLQPLELRPPALPSAQEQIDVLLALLACCHDSFKTVEGILAAIVQGWPVAVIGSPPSADQRLGFVQGLLNLLPVPARVGITFCTHATDPQAVRAQIKFTSAREVVPEHLVYDWGAGELLSAPPEDAFSHYIVGQFRLDPALVIEQTNLLARTTMWRSMQKEGLARTLAWVSRRAAIDQTVRQGQPADRQTVAAILREDPTLPNDLRQVYVRHLLAFALALNEPDSADVVPAACVANQEIAQAAVDQISAAIRSQQARTAFALLERWLIRVPETPPVPWQGLLHIAARQHLKDLLGQGETAAALEFISYVQGARPALRLSAVLPDLIRLAVPAARAHPDWARQLFVMAARWLPAGEFYDLLTDAAFVQQLPAEMQTAAVYLQPEPRRPAPAQVLDQGARVFGDGYRMIVLVRLVECAMFLQRLELIDTAALQALLVIAQSPEADEHRALIQHVVTSLVQFSLVQVLTPPGPRVLVQLMLEVDEVASAIDLLGLYQKEVYGPDRLGEFARLVGDLFRMAALPPDRLHDVLANLEGRQIRPEPRAMAYAGALANRGWADSEEYAAQRLTNMLFNDHELVAVIGYEDTLRLLDFHARRRNTPDALRVGTALVNSTINLGIEGAALITRMWPLITGDAESTRAALELVRHFVRAVPLRDVPTLIAYLRDQLGAAVGEMLKATYLMRLAMGQPDLVRFAHDVHTTAHLLIDLATAYHSGKQLPPKHRLRRDLDAMTGGLSEREREQVAQNVFEIMHLVFGLGRDQSRRHGRLSAGQERVVQGQLAPRSAAELLRFVGGHFADHQFIPLRLERNEMAHIFGTRSAAMFLRETNAITGLLHRLDSTFAPGTGMDVTPGALAAELDSLWDGLPLHDQRQIRKQLAADCQQLADVVGIIADAGNERVLLDSGLGRQLETGRRQPRTALETLRWTHGYFAHKHTRT